MIIASGHICYPSFDGHQSIGHARGIKELYEVDEAACKEAKPEAPEVALVEQVQEKPISDSKPVTAGRLSIAVTERSIAHDDAISATLG